MADEVQIPTGALYVCLYNFRVCSGKSNPNLVLVGVREGE